MATIKAYTDLEQSKKLAEILSIESADMYYLYWKENDLLVNTQPFVEDGYEKRENGPYKYLNCWSLSALLDLMPKIHGERPRLDTGRIQTEKYYVEYPYHESTKNDWYSTKLCDSAVDACYEMIMNLHELKML